MANIINRITSAAMLAVAFMLCATSAWAATPVAVWDGNGSAEQNFSTLTRTNNNITYTLNKNDDNNTISDTYIQVAQANQLKAFTITANDGATNPFGSGQLTVIIKCSNMQVNYDTSNRALITLCDGDTSKIGIYEKGTSGGFIDAGATYGAGGTQANVYSTGEQTIAMTYQSNANGTGYYVNGILVAQAGSLRYSTFTNPSKITIGGLAVAGSTAFYEMRQMKIHAIAIFTSRLSAQEVGSYVFPSDVPNSNDSDYYHATITEDTAWNDIAWDDGKRWSDSSAASTVCLDVASGKKVTVSGDITAKSIYLTNGTLESTGTVTVNAEIMGASALSVSSGTLTLSGCYRASGNTTVSSGAKLSLAYTGYFYSAVSGSGNVEVSSGTIGLGTASSLSGTFTVKSGAKAKAYANNVFRTASTSGASNVFVESGGVIDFNGYVQQNIYEIEGDGEGDGALINTGAEIGTGLAQCPAILLKGNASIGGTGNWSLLNSSYGTSYLGFRNASYTLTKKGSNRINFVNTERFGSSVADGNIKVESGTLYFWNSSKTIRLGAVALTVESGATVDGECEVALKSITIKSGATLSTPSAKDWTVASGYDCYGTLTINRATSSPVNVQSGGVLNVNANITGTVTGSGKIVYPTGEFPSVTGLNAAGWTGEVEVPSFTKSANFAVSFNSLGNSYSTVILKGINFSGQNYPAIYPLEASTATTINPTLQIDGTVKFTWGHSSELVTHFSKVTGTGDFLLDPCNGNATYKYQIDTLTNYTGTISAYNDSTYRTALSIGTLALDEGAEPTVSDRLVKINSGNNWANIINVDNIAVTVGGEATEYKLVKKNVGDATAGLYLAPATVTAANGTITPYESVTAAIAAAGDANLASITVFDNSATVPAGYHIRNNTVVKYPVVVVRNDTTFGYYDTVSGAIMALYMQYGQLFDENYDYMEIVSGSAFAIPLDLDVVRVKNTVEATPSLDGNPGDFQLNGDSSSGEYTIYTKVNKPTTYTWTGNGTKQDSIYDDEQGWISVQVPNPVWTKRANWSYVNANSETVTASRYPQSGDDVIFDSAANVTIDQAVTVASITNSVAVSFSATTAQTITSSEVVLSNAAASYTVDSNVSFSSTPKTSIANYVVKTDANTPSTGYTYYTAVLGAATVGGMPYLTLKAAVEAAGDNTITLLQDNLENDIVLTAGRVVNILKGGYTCVTPSTTDGVAIISDYDEESGITTYTSPRAKITPSAGSAVGYATTAGAFEALALAINSDEGATMTILDGSNMVAYMSFLPTVNIYYDSENGILRKAVAKTISATYGSLAAAISDSASGTTITLVRDSNEAITLNKAITLTETATFTGTLSGSGTLTLTALRTTAIAFDDWTGTVVIPTISTGDANFHYYGNADSVVRVTGMTAGHLPASLDDNTMNTTIDIPSGVTMTIDGFSPSKKNVIKAITGAGTFQVNVVPGDESGNALSTVASWADWRGTQGWSAFIRIGDASGFSGSLSASGAGIVIGDTKPNFKTPGGQIIVNSGETVSVGGSSTWTAGTIKVDGTVNVASGGSLSGSIAGGSTGKIFYATLPGSQLSFGTWTGTIKLPEVTRGTNFRFDYYGKSGSTIEFSDGFIGSFSSSNYQVAPTLLINSSFEITTSENRWYNFAKVSGSGDITVVQTGTLPAGMHLLDVEGYSGTIANTIASGTPTALTISRLHLAEAPLPAQLLVKTTTPNAVNLEQVKVNGEVQSLTFAKESDGIYVAVATYGGKGYKTLAAAIAAATSGGTVALLGDCDEDVTLPEGIVFSNGGYSYTGTITAAASITVSSVTTYYATLAEAITASGNANLANITVLNEAATLPEGYYLSGSVGSKVVTLCAARSGELGSYTYYNDVYAIFGALTAQVKPVLTILDGNGDSYYSTLFQTGMIAGLTYDSDNCTLFVAVAAIGDDKYPSLSEAIEIATDGQTIVLLSASSETITLNKVISLSGTALFSGTLSGNGIITLDALPGRTLVANDWRGTVVLPEVTGPLYVARFGVSGSTIELTSMTGSFTKSWDINSFAVAPNIKISGDCTVNLAAEYSDIIYSFQTLSGSGKLTLTGSANQINIAKLEGYTGVLEYNNESPTVSISVIDFATRPASDAKILSTRGTGNFTVGNVTVNGVTPSPALRWVRRRNGSAGDGFYIQGGTIFSVW